MVSLQEKSSILILTDKKSIFDFGANITQNLDEALTTFEKHNHPVIAFTATTKNIKKVRVFLDTVTKNNNPNLIFFANSFEDNVLDELLRNYSFNYLLQSDVPSKIEKVVMGALEAYDEAQQSNQLIELIHEKNKMLELESDKLEKKIKNRQRYLKNSQNNLEQTILRSNKLHEILEAIHQCNSIPEIEKILLKQLMEFFNIKWVKIILADYPEEISEQSSGVFIFEIPLFIEERNIGKILFAREDLESLSDKDGDLLYQTADAVSLSIDRLNKILKSESLKHQWESTFNAISDPICLTDDNFNIVKTNKSFIEKGSSNNLPGNQNCFKYFFSEDTDISPQNKFQFEKMVNGQNVVYDVFCQKITLDKNNHINLVIFHDLTEEQNLEKLIFESSKMAELGTIGSSIAHELNNPLAGIISFLQLIKMDINRENDYWDDITEMEKGAQKCKEIIENLLGFTRKRSNIDDEKLDLETTINSALKIIELKSKFENITIHFKPTDKLSIIGNKNILTQSFCNLLQNSIEAVQEKRIKVPKLNGHIYINLKENPNSIELEFSDNGIGFENHLSSKIVNPLYTTKKDKTGLGLTVAFQIILEHRAQMNISSQPMEGTKVKIYFKRPDFS